MSRVELPPVPRAWGIAEDVLGYDENDMRAYGEACARAALWSIERELAKRHDEARVRAGHDPGEYDWGGVWAWHDAWQLVRAHALAREARSDSEESER